MTAKKLFCILLSASALLAASCTFVKTTENEKEEKEAVEVKEDETEKEEEKEEKQETENENENENENTDEKEEIPENVGTDPVPTEDDVVFEYINVVRNTKPDMEGLDFGDEFTSSFSIPQLKAQSDNVASFNQKILDIYPDLAFEKDFSDEPVATECTYDYSYSYDVTDNAIVALVITESLGYYYSEGYTRNIFLYYDLKNDCEVAASDYLDALGIDYETIKQNALKTLYIKTATCDGIGSYDMRFADEYITIGTDIIPCEEEGFVNIEFSSDYGYYFVEIPTEEIAFEKATATNNAHIYATPTPEAEVLAVLDAGAELSVLCKAALAEGVQTIEYDENFEWYAVEYGNVRGYILSHELA